MKSFSVKSNAKRFAKGLAEKFSGIDAAAPVDDGNGAWYAAVSVAPGCLPDAVAPEVSEQAVIVRVVEGGKIDTRPDDADPGEQMPPVDLPAFLRKDVDARKRTETEGAALPPPTKSTRAEIDARLEERRAKRAAKAETEEAKAPRNPKGNLALDMMRREGGATSEALMEALGWQRHTLRGFISTQNSKTGAGIYKTKVGDVTTWFLPPAPAVSAAA